MAKIAIRIPEPKEQYDFSNQKQINRCFKLLMRDQLNSTFLDETKTGAREILLVFKWLIYIKMQK